MEQKILASKLMATASVADRLSYSIFRIKQTQTVPLTIEKLESLSESDMEVVDALLYRYGSLVSKIQDSLFKSIADAEGENLNGLSNRDKTNLMEKIGVLPSGVEFSGLAVVRNKLMHDYPEDAQKQLEHINEVFLQAENLVRTFVAILKYSEKLVQCDMSCFSNLQKHITPNKAAKKPKSELPGIG